MKHALFLAAVVAGALALSLLLVPSGEELALMHLKDRDYEAARERYEAEIANDGLRPRLVVALDELLIRNGDIDGAIALDEQLLSTRVDDIAVLERLLGYYADAQRPADYQRTLDRLTRIAPTPGRLLELADLHAFGARAADEIEVLERLIESDAAEPGIYPRLARLLAGTGRLDSAAEVLGRHWAEAPHALDPTALLLLAGLLVDTGGTERARAVANAALLRADDVDTLLRFAGMFERKQQPTLVVALADAFLERHPRDVDALRAIADIEGARTGDGALLARLGRLEAEGDLPPAFAPTLVELALQAGRYDYALDRVAALPLDALEPSLAEDLAEAALTAGRPAAVQALIAPAPGAQTVIHPLLAARLALALGDRAAALRWANAARDGGGLGAEERLDLVHLYRDLGEPDAAARSLARLTPRDLPPEAVDGLAATYLELDRAASGYAALAGPADEELEPALRTLRALLGAASGREREALAWAGGDAVRSAPAHTLDDFADVAERTGATALSAAVARERLRRRPNDGNRLLVAEALLADARPGEALATLRGARDSPRVAGAYREALVAAYRAGAPVAAELRRYFESRIAARGASDPGLRAFADDLIAIEAFDALLPGLERLAEGGDSAWYERYERSTEALGQASRLAAFLERELARSDLDPADRAARTRRLMAVAAPGRALPHVRRLAETGDPEWFDAYRELALRAGRRDDLIDYLAQALRKDALSPAERAQHIDELTVLGAADVALPYLRADASRGDASAQARLAGYYDYADAALALGRQAEVVAFLNDALGQSDLPDSLRIPYLAALADMGAAADALAHLRARAARRELADAARRAAYESYRAAALKAGRTKQLRAFVEAELQAQPPPSANGRAWLDELADVAGPRATLPYLEALANDPAAPLSARLEWFHSYKDAALVSGEHDALLAFVEARLEAEPPPGEAGLAWLEELRALAGETAVLPHLERLAKGTASRDPSAMQWYEEFKATAVAAGQRASLIDFVADRLAETPLPSPDGLRWLEEYRELAGELAALPYLRQLAGAAPTTSEGPSPEYEDYKATALAARRSDAVVAFVEDALAREPPPSPRGLQWVAELRELRGDTAVLPYLRQLAAEPTLSATVRGQFYHDYKAAAIAAGRRDEVIAFVRESLRRSPPPSASGLAWVAELEDLAGEPAALPYQRQMAADRTLPTTTRREAFEAYESAMLAAGERQALAAWLRLAMAREPPPTARGLAWLEAYREHAGEAAALPYLRALATDTRLTPVERLAWFHEFENAAMETGEPERLLEYLGEQLVREDLQDDTRTAYLQALADGEAPHSALGHLRRQAERRDLSAEARREWYYVYRDAALARGDETGLRDYLEEQLRAPDLARAAREERLRELADVAGAPATVPHVRTLAAYHAEATDEEWLYAFESLAIQTRRESELVAFLESELARHDVPRSPHGERLEMLLRHASPARALPVLADHAARDPVRWSDAYEAALLDLGDVERLAAHLVARATRSGARASEQRALAYELLELGQPAAAQRLFLALAKRSGPPGEDAATLMHIWGPRPPAAAIDWLARQAGAARGADRAAWVALLADSGAYETAAALLEDAVLDEGADPALVRDYLLALERAGATTQLERALPGLLDRAETVEMLELFARLADDHALAALSVRAHRQILARQPGHPGALRQLGMQAYYEGRQQVAARYLDAYLAGTDDDALAHFAYAQILHDAGFQARAVTHFHRVLGLLGDVRGRGDEPRAMQARALHRVGHTAAATVVYEELIARRPRDAELRADYADLLLDLGDLTRAGAVLSAR